MKQMGLLAGATLTLGAVLAYPSWLLGGESYLIQGLTALGLCLIPSLATLMWVRASAKSSPEMKLVATLGGSGVRLAVVLGVGIVLYWNWPEIYTNALWGWLLIFYIFTLTLEMILVVKQQEPMA